MSPHFQRFAFYSYNEVIAGYFWGFLVHWKLFNESVFHFLFYTLCFVYVYIHTNTHTHTHTHTHTLIGHFIRYTLLVPGWTHFCLQNCLNSSWHRFNKVLETFLRDFGSYWHDSITQFLQICRLHIHDVNLSFHHIPNVLYWIEIWWLWRLFE